MILTLDFQVYPVLNQLKDAQIFLNRQSLEKLHQKTYSCLDTTDALSW